MVKYTENRRRGGKNIHSKPMELIQKQHIHSPAWNINKPLQRIKG